MENTWIMALAGRLSCNKEEKSSVFQTVKRLMEYIGLVRRDGLLALTDVMEAEKDPFFKSCLRYIMEVSPEPDAFREYGTVCLSAASETGVRLLQKAVMVDGLLLLLEQTPPRAALLRLAAWLGGDFSEEIEAEVLYMDDAEKQRHREIRETREASVVPAFEALAELSGERLLQFCGKTDPQTLALALMGASGAVYGAMKRELPPARWKELEQEMDEMGIVRACDAEHAQKLVLQLLSERRDTF